MTVLNTVNGVDLDRLSATIAAVVADPALAKFEFRAANAWVDGGHTRTEIQGFFGVGHEDATRAAPFTVDAERAAHPARSQPRAEPRRVPAARSRVVRDSHGRASCGRPRYRPGRCGVHRPRRRRPARLPRPRRRQRPSRVPADPGDTSRSPAISTTARISPSSAGSALTRSGQPHRGFPDRHRPQSAADSHSRATSARKQAPQDHQPVIAARRCFHGIMAGAHARPAAYVPTSIHRQATRTVRAQARPWSRSPVRPAHDPTSKRQGHLDRRSGPNQPPLQETPRRRPCWQRWGCRRPSPGAVLEAAKGSAISGGRYLESRREVGR